MVGGGVLVCRFSIDFHVKCVVFSSYEEVQEADGVVVFLTDAQNSVG